jgi:hypothetical protein
MPLLAGRPGRFLVVLCAALLAYRMPGRTEQRTATAEDDIKAAFLLNFSRFVEWPESASTGSVNICTLAEPAFDNALSRTIAGESIDGRRILRATPGSPDAARSCHILFLSRMEHGVEGWVTALRGRPVLIVGETKPAADAGAHITFVLEDNRIKFDVNEDAASRVGLKISSKLLRVARHVIPRSTQ